MRLSYSKHASTRLISRLKKKVRIRKTVTGSESRPRLCVYRSLKHIYAQIIDDVNGKTLATASTVELEGKSKNNKEIAKSVGQKIAKKALEKNIKSVVFDRNGFLYHGRVKALADAAREAGLSF